MLRYIGIFFLAVSIMSCEKEPLECELLEVQASDCWNNTFTSNVEHLIGARQTTFITNSCEPTLPTSNDYDYLYIIYKNDPVTGENEEWYLYTDEYYGDNPQEYYTYFNSNHLIYNPN